MKTVDVIVGATYSEARFWKQEWDLDARPMSASAVHAALGLLVGTVYIAPGANRLNAIAFNRTMQELYIGQVRTGTKGQVVLLEDPTGHEDPVEPWEVFA